MTGQHDVGLDFLDGGQRFDHLAGVVVDEVWRNVGTRPSIEQVHRDQGVSAE